MYVQDKYRLDTMVNRITFDRMISALDMFVRPVNEQGFISQAVHDVLLVSYPNSIIQVRKMT